MPNRVPTQAIGHRFDGDDILVTVRHDRYASFSRSVIPVGKRFFSKAGLHRTARQWVCSLAPTTDHDDEGRCLTDVIFKAAQ
jgi:hypothetical protein